MKSGVDKNLFALLPLPRVSTDVTILTQTALTHGQCFCEAARQDIHCKAGQTLQPGTGRLPLNMCCNEGMEVDL